MNIASISGVRIRSVLAKNKVYLRYQQVRYLLFHIILTVKTKRRRVSFGA